MTDKKIIAQVLLQLEVLTKRVDLLERTNLRLEKENKQLRKKLSKYETPKHSGNSSIPPSKDENRIRANQSLRKSTKKKPGGQVGHQGKTLEMTSTPDKTIRLTPNYCRQCGSSLEHKLGQRESIRQVIDIPPIQTMVTQYESYSKICNCGCNNIASFPSQVKASVSYGENIESLIAYFHARQYLPFARMQEMFNDVFQIDISQGGLHCLLNRFADKTTPIYELIKQRISQSEIVGTDETGAKVNGKKHWMWTWQNKDYTYIAHSDNRGGRTIDANFPEGFPKSILVHDGWRAQVNTQAKAHQTCLPHLLRTLNYLNEKYKNRKWSVKFKSLLYDAMALNDHMTRDDHTHCIERTKIILRLQKLIENPPDKEAKELYTFYKRMVREQHFLLTFLFNSNVPADNNGSERAIRNIKVKQKISGQFKTEKAAQNFAKIRSIIDTIVKSRGNVVQALSLIAKFEFQI